MRWLVTVHLQVAPPPGPGGATPGVDGLRGPGGCGGLGAPPPPVPGAGGLLQISSQSACDRKEFAGGANSES